MYALTSKRLTAVFMVILFFISYHVQAADSFRCGNTRIKEGDTMHEVRGDCGEPVDEKRIGEKTVFNRYTDGHVSSKETLYVTEWIYENGSNLHVLTFTGSELTDVKKIKR